MKVSDWNEKPIWNLYLFNWMLAAIVTAMLALGLALTDFHVQATSALIVFTGAGLYGISGYMNVVSPARRNSRIAFSFTATSQMIVLLSTMISLTYIATSANLPLADTRLLVVDRALGWDFRSYLSLINDRPWLLSVLALAYRAIGLPILVITFVLPLAGFYRRAGEFVTAFTIALLVTTCVSTLLPATGVYDTIGILPSDFPNVVPQAYYDGMIKIPALRDGSLRELDLMHLDGVLTFPSFHAAAAVLYAWAFWVVRWFRPLAGIILAVASICLAHRISALCEGSKTSSAREGDTVSVQPDPVVSV